MTTITDKLAEAHRLGATGAEPTEEERLLFEQWMRGHCWALCATWNGKQYVSDAEQGGCVDPRAMNTRQLFAAWRDRAALAAYASQQADQYPDAGKMVAEPSDARVEAAAMALARMSYGPLALASDAAEWREHARAVLQAADAVSAGAGWQPIETAPKDGKPVMLGSVDGSWVGKWSPVYPSGYAPENPWFSLMLNHDHTGGRRGKPTHWMHLPAAPGSEQKEGAS